MTSVRYAWMVFTSSGGIGHSENDALMVSSVFTMVSGIPLLGDAQFGVENLSNDY